jgi:hypothetical protein
MNRLPLQRWTHDGKTYSVALVVEGKLVVGMTPVKIVVPKGCKSCNKANAYPANNAGVSSK